MIHNFKDERMSSLITELAGKYFNIESNKDALITIIKTEMENRGKIAKVFFTVLPEDKEEIVLEFMNRKSRDFRRYLTETKAFGFAPNIKFLLDQGERNRQRIDELLSE